MSMNTLEPSELSKQDPSGQVPNLAGILTVLRLHMEEFMRVYRVKNLGEFGSVVVGDAIEASDVDILVEFEETPTLFEFARLQRRLSELLD